MDNLDDHCREIEANAINDAHCKQIKSLYQDLYAGMAKEKGRKTEPEQLAADFQRGLTYARLAREMALAHLDLKEPAVD